MIKTKLEAKGFRIIATVDHSSNAAGVDLVLRPTTVIFFGNPNVGTKLMQCEQEFAINLPQKLLVYEDAAGEVWAAINSQVFLAEKYDATACFKFPTIEIGTDQTEPLIRKSLASSSVSQSVETIKTKLEEKGFRIFTTVDHSSNAAGVGLVLRPTTVIIFGNPNVGTKLMQCEQEYAIDLPQKLLVYENAEGEVWAVINSQIFLGEKHGATECEALVQKVNGKLGGLLNSL